MSQIEKDYFDWLYGRVYSQRRVQPVISYKIVCNSMHRLVFKNLVPHDGNRVADATGLRDEFLDGYLKRYSELDRMDLLVPEASVFEVLVGLAKRCDFAVDHGEPFWFSTFMTNLKLRVFSDASYSASDAAKLERALRKFNDRRYDFNGNGGIFPLKSPTEDQRKVELWYQMAAYMTENEMY
jgi:hypothetical protein